MEQTVTPVLGNVYVGCLKGAEDEELLQQFGITHILTVDIQLPRTAADMVRQVRRNCFMKLFFVFQFEDKYNG